MRVMAFDLLAILQRNGPGLEPLGFTVILTSIILVFVTLMLLGSRLLAPPCIFIVVITIGMPSDNILLDVGHGLQMSAVQPVLLPLDDDWVDVLWIWIFNLLE